MRAITCYVVVCACVALFAAPAQALMIDFDYSLDASADDFFGTHSDAKTSLEAAGDFFETNLLDDLDAISPGGGNTWTAFFTNPTDVTSVASEPNLHVPADTLKIFVGGDDLGSSTLGRGGKGGLSASGTSSWGDTVTTRGEGVTSGAAADEFGPWGGHVSFNSTASWHFDHTTTPPNSSFNDFYSVALHELAHLLGIGQADSWLNDVNDANDLYSGAHSVAEFGADVPLDPDPNDDAHWEPGLMSTVFPGGATQEAALDPNLTSGDRKHMTDLDMAALRDIGWDVVPEPASIAVLALGGAALLARRRRA